ncbi:MAG TPA: hypothetical protein VGO47_10950 [Chlamydiales bacterium]|nr:hypothetical protein [Chlamydiales bacterium]
MLEVMGNLAVEYGAAMDDDESYENQWRDIGIFTTAQWTVLMGKCLGSFSEFFGCVL